LLAGVDTLNHSRSQPISLHTSFPGGSAEEKDDLATISMISLATTISGEDVFNNYGLEANDELIPGYGFSLPHNSDDKITLRVGGSPDGSSCEWHGRTLERSETVGC
jgi:hypothetical protein